MSSKNPRKTILPICRIKTIMKTTPDVAQVSADAYFLVAKATESFITFLTEESYKNIDSDDDGLDYKDVANAVQYSDTFEFLRGLIPKKITVGEYRQIMEEKTKSVNEEDFSFYLNRNGDNRVNGKI